MSKDEKTEGRVGPPILCWVCKNECSPVACVHCAKELQARRINATDVEFDRTPAKDEGESVLDAIPANWCDPLLSGSKAIIGWPPYSCQDIEKLLNGIRERIKAKPTAPADEGERLEFKPTYSDDAKLLRESLKNSMRENATLRAALAEKEKNEKYWLEQHGIEVGKRGEAEHQLDLARGDKAAAWESLEREVADLRAQLAKQEGPPV